MFYFFKQKTAYEMRISDWSSDVCSSDLGAGKIIQTPRGASYSVSQRAEHIWEGVSSATTRSRPIINTRDEPHADAEKYRRLHVIVGDSNMKIARASCSECELK